ncbi:MAG: Ribosomal RNA small subunit methyltransferase I [Candidatus Yanofskybacteria bacterium GW2011_GWA1_39_13]|uniref:Ribosomal RNA small subunit methyltransferase I n=1 Tax=Yanofskybacteria sp. (strain GW2011_GWA1_39_13) TaxID=1619019 RepID=A0A0G0MHR3_YANXG|nr:MAG: Ribosomal RNA small subunit methyltransferase I [Candidatus Yanofskybacteria bacterium GW2011_GWA1_39_13]
MLYIVATPIGNLEDITPRAINILSNSDLILAEDTRVTKVLLDRYNIKKEVQSYHQHSDFKKIDHIVELLKQGKTLSLVTDAGTPGINDPGSHLVSEALKAIPDLKVVPIPGPNAAIAALSISGFATDEFVFLGFPPHKKGRQTFFKNISKIESTVVFYESKHRILKALDNLEKLSDLGERKMMIGRELTKQFETIYRGTLAEIKPHLTDKNLLGEFVVVINRK